MAADEICLLNSYVYKSIVIIKAFSGWTCSSTRIHEPSYSAWTLSIRSAFPYENASFP